MLSYRRETALHMQEYGWTATKLIFNYTGSPSENIAKSFKGYMFDSHCRSSLYNKVTGLQSGSQEQQVSIDATLSKFLLSPLWHSIWSWP